MQSLYSSPYQAAVAALEYMGIGRRLLAIFIVGVILLIPLVLIGMAFHSGEAMAAGEDA